MPMCAEFHEYACPRAVRLAQDPRTKHTGAAFSPGAHASLPFADPVTAGRDAVVLAEGLGERCGCLVPDAGGNSIDGVVAGFEHEGGFVHSTRHHVSMHWLANQPRKPR